MKTSASHSANVRMHLRATEEVVRALRKDLDYYREQNDALLKERSDLIRTISRTETVQGDRSHLDGELSFTREERDRLADALHTMQSENEELTTRCARLEDALAHERRMHNEAREVIIYLEAQVEQFESMLEMLREHKQFRE